MIRVAQAVTVAAITLLSLTACVTLGGGGPTPKSAISWARATSAEVVDAVDVAVSPTSVHQRQDVCTAIDYSTENWVSWVITTDLPFDPGDRLPLLARVTKAYADRPGWTVLGDNPGEIGPTDEALYVRGLRFNASVDDQGAEVTVSPDSSSVEIRVSSACYVDG